MQALPCSAVRASSVASRRRQHQPTTMIVKAVPVPPVSTFVVSRVIRGVKSPRRILARAAANAPNGDNNNSNKSEAELTTEKYGLEAGLWKVLTSKKDEAPSSDADASSSSTSSSSQQPLSRTEQAKALLKTYGSAYLITSISFAVVSFGACYALVTAGVDVGALVEKLPSALGGGARPGATGERVGAFAIAYAAHKALSPVRFPPTVALTPVVARWLGRKPAAGDGESK